MNTATIKRPTQSGQPTTQAETSKGSYIVWTLLVLLIGVISIVANIKVQKGGWLYPEFDMFLVDHTTETRSFLSKIVCPHSHDAGSYQARELSHFLEYFDANFIDYCVKQGHPHFYSLLNFVFVLAIGMGQWFLTTRYLKTDRWMALCLSGLFWTAPSIFLSGVAVRMAKQGASLVLFFMVWFIVRKMIAEFKGEAPEFKGKRAWVLGTQGFVFALILTFLDQQGVFMAGCCGVTLLFLRLFRKSPAPVVLGTAMIAAVLVHWFYGRYIGPVVIKKLTGFTVSFEYQKLPLKELFDKPFEFLWKGLTLTLDTFRWYLGNVTAVVAFGLWIIMTVVFARIQINIPAERAAMYTPKRLLGIIFVGWVVLIIGMTMLMTLRHPPLVWADVRRFQYYWIPTTVLVMIVVAFFFHHLQHRFGIQRNALRVILLAFFLSNIFELPSHIEAMQKGFAGNLIYATPILLQKLKDLAASPPGPNAGSTTAKRYDYTASSYEESFERTLRVRPNAQGQLDVQAFLNSSHYYNYLRSKRGYDFVQELP